MRGPLLLSVIAAGLLGVAAAHARPAKGGAPVVVELFTAQGCASCPEADKRLAELADRKGVVALTFPVDYWDYLGWADTFAQPGFTERQRAYAHRLKVREIYTPEIVVDGAAEVAGLDKTGADALLDKALRDPPNGPRVRLLHAGAKVQVSPGRGDTPHADVWLIRYDPSVHTVRVKQGDNKGKLVVQKNVVRELRKLGGYTGGVRTYAAPKPGEDGLDTVILVQGVRGGKIFAVVQQG